MNVFRIFILMMGLMLFSCGKDDPCDGITCDNGDCINGICDCVEGFTGPSCSEELIPSVIRATSFSHIASPEFDPNGNFWDTTGGNAADIYIRVYQTNDRFNTLRDSRANALSDQTHDDVRSFNFSYTFSNPNEFYTIEFLDADAIIDDLIGSGSIMPYQAGRGFPIDVNIGENSGPIAVGISYEYEF